MDWVACPPPIAVDPRDPDRLWIVPIDEGESEFSIPHIRARLAQMYLRLGRYGDARALLRDTVGRLERTLPDGDPLITELRRSLADIGDE